MNPGAGQLRRAEPVLAHLSDLHLGKSAAQARVARELVCQLLTERVDHVVITGDLTHGGRADESRLFHRIFAPLRFSGRVTFVPGNHDRQGDDPGAQWMRGERVRVLRAPDLYLIQVDSTGRHNRSFWRSHGELDEATVERIEAAARAAPVGCLVAVLLHHHVFPLPEESFQERLASRLGWPHAAELSLGPELLSRLLGYADLVLHGHRHVPSERVLAPESPRPLRIVNAGSSTEMGRFRMFQRAPGGVLARWSTVRTSSPPRAVEPTPAFA